MKSRIEPPVVDNRRAVDDGAKLVVPDRERPRRVRAAVMRT